MAQRVLFTGDRLLTAAGCFGSLGSLGCDLHREGDLALREEGLDRAIEMLDADLGDQLLPGETIGEVPGGCLGRGLIDLAVAEHFANFNRFLILSELGDRLQFIGDAGIGIFLAMLQAHGRYFDLAHLLGSHVEKATLLAAATKSSTAWAGSPFVALTRAKEQIIIFASDKLDKSSWANKIKKFLQLQVNPEFNFLLKNITDDECKIQIENSQSISEQSYFEMDEIKSIYTLSSDEKKTISFTTEKKEFYGKNSIESILTRQEGIEKHFSYESTDDHLAQLISICPTVEWGKLLSIGYKEFGFSFKKGDDLVTGSIDLWGIVDDVCYIVDY